jgi:ABC-type multidrug transport system ATPase subunit
MLGVIGPSAAGKSTLARLLVGVWPPASGHVRLDGSDLANWPRDQLGNYVGYLPQDVELLSGTVAENIARLHEPEPENVIAAAKLCDAHEMILRLPDGYGTQIGEAGCVLSGGQRQRIGLARALYGDPCLVVLDEPNANLDSDGEAALLETLQRLKAQKRTVVIVSHRPAVLTTVDLVAVLRARQLETVGPRSEVLPRLMSATGHRQRRDRSAGGSANPGVQAAHDPDHGGRRQLRLGGRADEPAGRLDVLPGTHPDPGSAARAASGPSAAAGHAGRGNDPHGRADCARLHASTGSRQHVPGLARRVRANTTGAPI